MYASGPATSADSRKQNNNNSTHKLPETGDLSCLHFSLCIDSPNKMCINDSDRQVDRLAVSQCFRSLH